MEKVAFIGGYDKTDLILSIARILTIMQRKVLFVDTTVSQKTRYIVPAMRPGPQYVTTYQDIDVAIGFKNYAEIMQYLGVDTLNYDFVLFDIDNAFFYQSFGLTPNDKHFFVSSFDLYSLRKGLGVLAPLQSPVNMTKVLFVQNILKKDDDYLNYISQGLKINWAPEPIYFPFDTNDLNGLFRIQRSQKIHTNGMSTSYVDSLRFLVEMVSGQRQGDVKRAVKIMNS